MTPEPDQTTARLIRATGGSKYHAVLPAAPEAVAVARAFARAVASSGRADEVELIASELASCILGEADATFSMTAWREPGRVRLEVATSGSGWWPTGHDANDVEYACRLAVISALADGFGHYGTMGGTAALWAEMICGEG